MRGEELQNTIEQAARENWEELDLSEGEFTGLPAEIEKLTQLKRLKLGGCVGLKRLPEGIGRLSSLEQLELWGALQLTSLPESIGQCRYLVSLDLSNCVELRSLPEIFGLLPNLEELFLGGCAELTALPESIGGLSALTALDLDDCAKLTSLPESIGGLTSLRELELSNCTELKSLPESFGRLTALEKLNLNGTPLADLPDSINRLTSCDITKGYGFYTGGESFAWHSKRNPELEAAIGANPDDREAWSVYGDWLQEQGDPRGEMVALGLDSSESLAQSVRGTELFQAQSEEWLGPVLGAAKGQVLEWKYGFIHSARIKGEETGPAIPVLLQGLLENPSSIFLYELVVNRSHDQITNMKSLDKPLFNSRRLPNLRCLRLQGFTLGQESMELILKSSLLVGLTTLELSRCMMGRAGGECLLENADAFLHLEKIDLSGTRIGGDEGKLRQVFGERLVRG